jgi:hypothetical protein
MGMLFMFIIMSWNFKTGYEKKLINLLWVNYLKVEPKQIDYLIENIFFLIKH